MIVLLCEPQFSYEGTKVCTNPGCQVAMVTGFCMLAPNVCGSSVWNFLHVTCLAPGILRCFLDF